MIECQECDEGQVQKHQTPYGCKQVCDSCGHVAKDVDTYAGVMVWSHKTAPEIEIHASKASAQTVLSSSRSRVVQNPVQVKHHAPREMGGRRQNNGRVERESTKASTLSARQRSQIHQRTVTIPPTLSPHVRKMVKGDPTSLQTFTRFTANEVKKVLTVLPHTSSMEELSQALGLRAGKEKKPIGILSWLSSFGHAEPFPSTDVWQDGDRLVLKTDVSREAKGFGNALDAETRRALGYKSATNRYN